MKRSRAAMVAGAATMWFAGCYTGASLGDGGETDAGGPATAEGPSGSGGSDTDADEPSAPLECDGEVLDPGPNLVRRLTVTEYANTVDAVLGIDVRTEAVERLPPDLRADGFTNTTSGLITTLAHIEAYEALAETIVGRIDDLEAFASEYTSCLELTDDCKRQYVERLGLPLFRRPLRPDEVDLLALAFDIAEEEGQSFAVGAGLVLEAMLQSPPFLYRLEDETSGDRVRALGGFEIASRLSYLLWSGPPDEALLDAAANDRLGTDAEIAEAVERMLADPRARQASLGFVRDWLNLGRLDNLPRDPQWFPDWSGAIAADMVQETLGFFESVAWDQERALADLFSAQESYLTPELAAYYGIEPQGGAASVYDLSGVPERGGLLTQGTMATIGGNDGSMVARGLFIFENILCQHPTSPPEGVDTTPPALEPGKSQRYYSEERLDNSACRGCHLQFEPISWGLERYLADGSYSDVDAYGNELREDGFVVLPGQSSQDFSDAAELMEILAGSEAVRACLGSKATQFAIGRALNPTDACSLGTVHDAFAGSVGTWADLMLAIASSPGFRSIRVEKEE